MVGVVVQPLEGQGIFNHAVADGWELIFCVAAGQVLNCFGEFALGGVSVAAAGGNADVGVACCTG